MGKGRFRKYWAEENGTTSPQSDSTNRFQRWWLDEKGMSSIVIFILGMPLIIVAFGYGFDSLRLIYVKDSLQGTLNRATQTGVSQTVSYTGQRVDSDGNLKNVALIGLAGNTAKGVPVTSNPITARDVAYRFYTWNTADFRSDNSKVLECTPAPGLPATVPAQKGSVGAGVNTEIICGGNIEYVGAPLTASELCDDMSDPASAKYGLRYTVTETVSAAFLRIAGIQNHYVKDLTSVSYVRGNGC